MWNTCQALQPIPPTHVNGGTDAFYLNVILLMSSLQKVSSGVLVIYQ